MVVHSRVRNRTCPPVDTFLRRIRNVQIELNGEDYGWNREGENVGKYRIVLVQMGKVIVESNRKTIVLVMLTDTRFGNAR